MHKGDIVESEEPIVSAFHSQTTPVNFSLFFDLIMSV